MRLGLLVAIAALATSISAAHAADWYTYHNERFGISADVPAEGFMALQPPANGDGRTWVSDDGRAKILVYGNFMVLAKTLPGYQRLLQSQWIKSGADITYSASGKNWVVVSGISGREIFYEKAVLNSACNSMGHVELLYPKSERAYFDLIVKRMASTLVIKGGLGC